jgi:hypothetical protein
MSECTNKDPRVLAIDRPQLAEVALFATIVPGLVAFHVFNSLPALIAIYLSLLLVTVFVQAVSSLKFQALALFLAYSILYLLIPVPYLNSWPFDMFIIVGVSWFVLGRFGNIDFSANWSIKFTKIEWLSFLFISIPSVIFLTVYFKYFPEIAKKFPLPEVPIWSLPLLVFSVALVNGLREELVYRLIFQRTFLGAMAPVWAILLQSLAFGFLHFRNGFPQGWIGVGLTTLFGILMGIQFHLTRKMSLAWLTHAFVDAAMFTIIILNR